MIVAHADVLNGGMERYELCEWRRCKVAPDYHVRVDYMHYSVPNSLIGREVDVRVTAKRVTVFDGGEAVADHARLRGRKGQYSTVVEYMTENHAALDSPWSADRFTSWADRIGPETGEAIRRIMSGREVVEQSFVPCRNVLGLSKQYGPGYLERACAMSNQVSTHPSYTGIKSIVLSLKAAGAKDANARHAHAPSCGPAADNDKSAGRVRGADAYRRPGKGGGDDFLLSSFSLLLNGGRARCAADALNATRRALPQALGLHGQHADAGLGDAVDQAVEDAAFGHAFHGAEDRRDMRQRDR